MMSRNVIIQVPFIDNIPDDGRVIFLQPYYDKIDNKFKLYLQEINQLTYVFAEPVDCCYWAEKIIDKKKDIYLEIINTIAQHYSYEPIINDLIRILSDIRNFSIYACMAQVRS